MGEFKNIIRELRKSSGYTQHELAAHLGITRSRLAMYESGSREPDFETLELIADFFNVDIDYLMGRTNKTTVLPQSFRSPYGSYRIPVVATVACGLPLFSESNIDGYIDWDKDTDSVFAVHTKGDSMEPKIGDGYLVIVDKEAAWEDGDIVVVTVNGNDGCCKRIKKYKDSIALLSLNPAYEPLVFTDQEVQSLPVVVQGKVIQVRWDL